jgi:hypothetical protein
MSFSSAKTYELSGDAFVILVADLFLARRSDLERGETTNGDFAMASVQFDPGRPVATELTPHDYAVFAEADGSFCLQAARTGRILERSSQASDVLQKAIDLFPPNGGKVYVASGSYRLDRPLLLRDKHGVHLEGAARGMQGREKGGTVLWSDRPIHLIEIFGDRQRIFGVTVSNLLLYGSGKSNGAAGILAHGTTDAMTFANVGANECGIGFHLKGGRGSADSGIIDAAQIYFCDPQINGIGVLIERAHYAKIMGGEFSDCANEGIRLSGAGAGAIQGVKIVGVTAVRNGGAGLFVGKHCDDIAVTGGTDVGGTRRGSGIVVSAEDEADGVPRNILLSGIHSYNNDEDGIALDRAHHVIVNGCICSVHRHDSVNSASQNAGIRIGVGTKNAVVTGNIAYGNRTGILDETGAALLSANAVEER